MVAEVGAIEVLVSLLVLSNGVLEGVRVVTSVGCVVGGKVVGAGVVTSSLTRITSAQVEVDRRKVVWHGLST